MVRSNDFSLANKILNLCEEDRISGFARAQVGITVIKTDLKSILLILFDFGGRPYSEEVPVYRMSASVKNAIFIVKR